MARIAKQPSSGDRGIIGADKPERNGNGPRGEPDLTAGERDEQTQPGDRGEHGSRREQDLRGEQRRADERDEQVQPGDRGEQGLAGDRDEQRQTGQRGMRREQDLAGERDEQWQPGQRGEHGEQWQPGQRGEHGLRREARRESGGVERAVVAGPGGYQLLEQPTGLGTPAQFGGVETLAPVLAAWGQVYTSMFELAADMMKLQQQTIASMFGVATTNARDTIGDDRGRGHEAYSASRTSSTAPDRSEFDRR